MKQTNRWLKGFDWICQSSLVVSAIMMLVLLSACSHVPLMSMAKLSRFDPMTADPAHLRVAVKSPAWLRVPKGGAVMKIGAKVPAHPEETIDETFELIEHPQHDLPAKLADEVAGAEHVAVYRLNPDDLPRLYAAKNEIRHLQQTHAGKVKGHLTVDATGCLAKTAASGQMHEARVTIYFKTSPTEAFFPLIRNYDLMQDISSEIGQLPACNAS